MEESCRHKIHLVLLSTVVRRLGLFELFVIMSSANTLDPTTVKVFGMLSDATSLHLPMTKSSANSIKTRR